MTLTISGCKMDGEEGMEIHADGALTMRVNYQFPELGFSLKEGRSLVTYIEDLDRRLENISVNELSCERAGNATVRLIIEIHIEDAMQLSSEMKDEAQYIESNQLIDEELLVKVKAVMGEISIGVQDLNIQFSRTIMFGDLLKREMPQLNPDLLGSYQFRYSLTSPRAAKNHNASSTSNLGKTLTWVMPLKQHFDQPFIMEATLPIPIPWWGWLLVGLVLLLLWLIFRKVFSFVMGKYRAGQSG